MVSSSPPCGSVFRQSDHVFSDANYIPKKTFSPPKCIRPKRRDFSVLTPNVCIFFIGRNEKILTPYFKEIMSGQKNISNTVPPGSSTNFSSGLSANFSGSLPWPLAVPSFVFPDTVAGNCRQLVGKYPEIALTFFEGRACLDYTEDDLPPSLADLPLRYHVHMPLDLPWNEGKAAVSHIVRGLVRRAAFLSPSAYVVHAIEDVGALDLLAECFAAEGVAMDKVLLENIGEFDPAKFATHISRLGFSVCLDLGHMLAYGQEGLVDNTAIAQRTRMLHLNAPDRINGTDRHHALNTLDTTGQELLRRLLGIIRPGETVVLELFSPDKLNASLAELNRLCRNWGYI